MHYLITRIRLATRCTLLDHFWLSLAGCDEAMPRGSQRYKPQVHSVHDTTTACQRSSAYATRTLSTRAIEASHVKPSWALIFGPRAAFHTLLAGLRFALRQVGATCISSFKYVACTTCVNCVANITCMRCIDDRQLLICGWPTRSCVLWLVGACDSLLYCLLAAPARCFALVAAQAAAERPR